MAEDGGCAWEFLPPAPGREGDQGWVIGPCWFFCDHQVTPVTWIGAISAAGAHAPLFACRPCLTQLHAMTWDYTEATRSAPIDADGRPVPLYGDPARDSPTLPVRWLARARHPARTAFGRRLRRLLGSVAQG
ncbi:hypothetical protein FH609_015170 [Streptomyces sp. 3MP-14]|uniref:Uncharacterized protein n=1 Tax=Streptomyces mimosae TaxID=2586635 RepID=A0A5N6ABY5_9ACTN|nr:MULTISPECIES: hypothetical protein [Streptomyces]KAB8165752.1 hypothetical protein FH607_012495 [Streptomyces mimosae]KAB8176141.1 hypothetical protein FH609_015170 [Streptomyces sp. 3MP-14]